MQKWKRVRAPNFSLEEKDLLMEIVNRHKHILDNRTDHISIQEKQETWLQVAAKFNMEATTDRNWRCLKTAYDNIKKKMKRDTIAFSDMVRENDGQAMSDEPVQMPLNVVLDIGERAPSPPTVFNSIIKVEKEFSGDEELTQATNGKREGRGLRVPACTNPMAQWSNWQSGYHGGTTNHTGLEPTDCILQTPTMVPEPNVPTTLSRGQSVLSTTRSTNRLFNKPGCNSQKRTAYHKRVTNDWRGRNLVELAFIKRRYYQRLLEMAEEQHETKLRMAEMAEEQHIAKLKMIEAKTNFFLKKLDTSKIK